jgi:phospholipid/cholesterol/gamma-HCH transport system permease protein
MLLPFHRAKLRPVVPRGLVGLGLFSPCHSMGIIGHIGQYFHLLKETFSRPERFRVYWSRTLEEMDLLGIKSIGIVALLSFFMGAVITIQTKTNIDSPLIQAWVVGFATRQSTILEFSPTIIALILAGKVGSNIAAEIGSMRVKEQIDALDIMGVNSAGFLILPKIVASMFMNPFLVMVSMFLSIFGGYVAGTGTGIISATDYLQGIQTGFIPYHITYALIKTVVFAFIIATVSAYQGYYTIGGTREVGISSTKAVVYSNVVILIANYALTQFLLV